MVGVTFIPCHLLTHPIYLIGEWSKSGLDIAQTGSNSLGTLVSRVTFHVTYNHIFFRLRTLLGALEAAYFPICVYILTSWYTRSVILIVVTQFDMVLTVIRDTRYEVSPRFGFFFMTSGTTFLVARAAHTTFIDGENHQSGLLDSAQSSHMSSMRCMTLAATPDGGK